MNEIMISFETSKLLNKKIPSIYSDTMFTCDGDICNTDSILGSHVGKFPRLSQALLQKYLRENYKIHIQVCALGFNLWSFYLKRLNSIDTYLGDLGKSKYKSYEEALEQGLYQTLKLINNN